MADDHASPLDFFRTWHCSEEQHQVKSTDREPHFALTLHATWLPEQFPLEPLSASAEKASAPVAATSAAFPAIFLNLFMIYLLSVCVIAISDAAMENLPPASTGLDGGAF